MDSISDEESYGSEGSQQATIKVNDFANEMNCNEEQTECAGISSEGMMSSLFDVGKCDSDFVKVETNGPVDVKINNKHELSHAHLETGKSDIGSMFTCDNSLSKAPCGSEDVKQLNVKEKNKENVIDPGDIKMEIEIYTCNGIANREEGIESSDGKEALRYNSCIKKQNINHPKVVDIEQLSYKSMDVEKTEDDKEEDNMDSPSDIVGVSSQYAEQMTVELNGSRDEVGCDNVQKEYDMTEHIKCDIDIKKEKTDPEDVVSVIKKWVNDGTVNSEIYNSFDAKYKDNSVILSTQRYCCKFCGYKTNFINSLKEHLENKHREETQWYYCLHCEFKATNKKYLKGHIKMNHDDSTEWYKCQHCEFNTKCKKYLKEHSRRQHDDNAKWYKCKFCDLQTKRKSSLIRHYNTQHDQDSECHNCKHCAFKTKYKRSLDQHLEDRHNIVSREGKLHQCQFCDYRSRFKSILMRHLKSEHSQNVEWHHCQYCEYKTNRKQYLTRHFKCKHSQDVELYHCQHCEYKANRKDHLTNHLKVKHSQKVEWLHCQHCDFKTKNKYSLIGHSSYKHDVNVVWYNCRLCDLKTRKKAYLKQHYKTQHNQVNGIHVDIVHSKQNTKDL